MAQTATTASIIACTSPTELFRQYDGQHEPQPAYIELDIRDGQMLADYDSEIGNAAPGNVRTGIVRRYPIPLLTGDAANRLMAELLPLAQRIVSDSEVEFDGNNWVAVLGDDAAAANDAIDARLTGGRFEEETQGFSDADIIGVWDLDGAVNGYEAEENDITADTTDDRLEEISAEIHQGIAGCGDNQVVVIPGLTEYLQGLRAKAIAEAAADDENA